MTTKLWQRVAAWLNRMVRFLRRSTKTGYRNNEYGVLVSVHVCAHCGAEFTVCPPVQDTMDRQWMGCLSKGCKSYVPGRDVDALFEKGDHRIVAGAPRYLNSKSI